MQPRLRPLALLLAALALTAGCLGAPDAPPAPAGAPRAGALAFDAGGAEWRYEGGAGALSTLTVERASSDATVALPEGTLWLDGDDRLLPATEPTAVKPGATLRFLPSPGLAEIQILAGDEKVVLPTAAAGARFVDGENVVRLLEVQRDQFPHRTPGHENYVKSQAYFGAYFEALGYDVEIDPYGLSATNDVTLPEGPTRGTSPASLANVVAYKRGTTSPERYLVFGGHYDVVAQTRDGALDNTGGAVTVLELARAFANVTTSHTLVFALWGGEEDGLLGSRFWTETNAPKLPFVTAYYNLDPPGLAWPGPAPEPAPILVTTGLDGPLSDGMTRNAQHVAQTFMRFDGPEFVYQPMVVGGQVGGAGINAQSDHASFATHGIPTLATSTSDVQTVFSIIHEEQDTVDNLTAYMATGRAAFDEPLTAEEAALGRDLLARSFETQLWIPFYLAVLADALASR